MGSQVTGPSPCVHQDQDPHAAGGSLPCCLLDLLPALPSHAASVCSCITLQGELPMEQSGEIAQSEPKAFLVCV